MAESVIEIDGDRAKRLFIPSLGEVCCAFAQAHPVGGGLRLRVQFEVSGESVAVEVLLRRVPVEEV